MANNLPVDLFMEIFSRLTIKFLLRLRCVCKSWYSIIQSPTFIAAHLARQNRYILFQFHKNDESQHYRNMNTDLQGFSYSLRRNNEAFDQFAFDEYYVPEFSGFSDPNSLGVYGICNGLICLSDKQLDLTSTIFLWNPIARKVKILPKSETTPFLGFDYSYDISLVFGYCNNLKDMNHEYKLLKMVSIVAKDGHFKSLYRIEIYSLSTNCWKIIRDSTVAPFPSYYYVYNGFAKFVNGAAYWITNVYNEIYRKMRKIVVCFDMEDEVFREIELPVDSTKKIRKFSARKPFRDSVLHEDRKKDKESMSIEAFGESLALFVRHGSGSHSLDMWVLENCGLKENGDQSSWRKKLTFDLQLGEYSLLLGFRNKDEFLVAKNDHELYLWDPELSRIDPFVESLVLLDEKSLQKGNIEGKQFVPEAVAAAAADGVHMQSKFSMNVTTSSTDVTWPRHEINSMVRIPCYFINTNCTSFSSEDLSSCDDVGSELKPQSLKRADILLPNRLKRLRNDSQMSKDMTESKVYLRTLH